uniref:RNA-directed RNA polymerase n=1 Tax=Birch toti-like virus TaxID=3143166 RepID=A0AAU6W4E3_9VIRU
MKTRIKDSEHRRGFKVLSRDNIPVWCNIRDNTLTVCEREKCRYVLAHVSYGNETGMPGYGEHRIGRDSYRAIAVKCEDFWLYYVKTSCEVTTMSQYLRKTMSAMYSCVDGYDLGDVSGMRYLRREFSVDRMAIARSKVGRGPGVNEFERSKITAEHHTHYRPEEVWDVAKNYKVSMRAMQLAYEGLRKIEGVNEAVVSTFLTYLLFARPQVAYIVACSRELWGCRNITELLDKLKKLSAPIKSMHNYEICDMTQLFELQSLVNRGIGSVDWKSEKQDRIKPDVVKIDPQTVYQEAVKIFEEGVSKGYKYSRLEADKYVKGRWEWVPTGSVHSQYFEDKCYIKKDYRHRTKFVTLNMMPAERVRLMFQRRPEIHSWASVKYEWAKQRAIYGVDLTSSVITNFAMYRCEEVFKHRFPVGEDAEASRVHKRLKMMLQDNESFCYDFDNFNAQHSTESMQAVLLAYYDVFSGEMTIDQRAAMEWVIESVKHMTIHNNEVNPEDKYEAKGTLLSGWRLTTFMNTALNFIYFKVAGVFEVEGVKDSVHNGDDVLVAIRNLKAATKIHKQMADLNARAQATKCNVFSVGEFLRVEHKLSKETGLGAQYLSRAAATMVHSRVESQVPTRLTEAIKANVTRCEEIAARAINGAEIAKDMLDKSLVRLAEVFACELGDCEKIAQTHAILGGAIAGKQGKIEFKIEEIPEYERKLAEESDAADTADVSDLMNGIGDYSRLLYTMFGEYMSESIIRKKVSRATERQLLVTRRTRLTISSVKNETRYKYGRELFREYRKIIAIPHIEKARFLGIPPIAMVNEKGFKKIKDLIEHVTDVEYTLQVLL